jgi:hypothetical protein
MTGALAGLAGFFPGHFFLRLGRDHHQPAISHPALGDDVVCQNGVMDYVLHPMEPLAVRLTLVGSF